MNIHKCELNNELLIGHEGSLTLVAAPNVLHAIAMQRHARQFAERFTNIEIAEWWYLKAGHIIARCVGLRLFGGHLTFVGQMQAIAYKHFGYAGRMLQIDLWCIFVKFVPFAVLTSSTSLSQRSMPSKLHLFVISYTNIIPWAPREYERIMVQKRPWPEVSQICSLTRLPSSNIVVVLYATVCNMWEVQSIYELVYDGCIILY